jgi:hypothetical protein
LTPFSNSPSDVLRWLLIGAGVGTDPSLTQDWPIYVANDPEEPFGSTAPDDCITILDTAGEEEIRSQPDNEVFHREGVQILVRAATHPIGYAKAATVRQAIIAVINASVLVGTASYFVPNCMKIGQVLPLGRDRPNSARSRFSINCQLVAIQGT